MSPFDIHFCLLSIRNGVLIQVLIKKSNAVCVFENLCPTFRCGSYIFQVFSSAWFYFLSKSTKKRNLILL